MKKEANLLADEMREFLLAFKNAETLSDDLRAAISVRSAVETAVLSAVGHGATVLITGSAGSGKTHLLADLEIKLPAGLEVVEEPTGSRKPHLLVVRDATERTVSEIVDIGRYRPAACKGKIIAINEGPLRAASEKDDDGIFTRGLAALHAAQRGIEFDCSDEGPVLVDMAAFDPLETSIVAELMSLPIIKETVKQTAIAESGDLESSLRWEAWQLLESAEVRNRLCQVVRLAKLDRPEWLFRDIWDFIADLAIGGQPGELLPSTVWFWRLFKGASSLSRALARSVDIESLCQPSVDARLYYGDWFSDQLELVDELEPVIVSNTGADPERFEWAKIQLLLFGKKSDLPRQVLFAGQDKLLKAVHRQDCREIVKSINSYMTLGYRDGDSTALNLWVSHAIERRPKKIHRGMIRLGRASVGDFTISRSRVVSNHPEGGIDLAGHNFFLIHKSSRASLSLDQRRLRILENGRSLRLVDRDQKDLDWDLYQFFSRILSSGRFGQDIGHIVLNPDSSEMDPINVYTVVSDPPMVGEAQ